MNRRDNILIFINRIRGSIMKEWMMKAIYQHLKSNGLIKLEMIQYGLFGIQRL